jgi:hypothetical protein
MRYNNKNKCENNNGRLANGGCYNGEISYELTIKYNKFEYEKLLLCDYCYKLIKQDAKKYGYKTKGVEYVGETN